jgi:hypothetical protein
MADVCNDLLSDKRVTYFQPLSSRYGNYLESELQKLRKDQWANRSDEYKLQCSDDGKRWWANQSDEYKLQCSVRMGRDGGPIGQMSTSCSAVRMRRDGGTNGQTRTSCSAVRMGRGGGANGQTRASWIGVRISRSGGTISLRSISRSGVIRMSKGKENMTYENFLLGKQKNQYITLLMMEQVAYILITKIYLWYHAILQN